MPNLLRDFEAHEKMRLEKVKEYIKKFVELWTPIVPDTKASNERIIAKVDLVNVQSDLNLFVNSIAQNATNLLHVLSTSLLTELLFKMSSEVLLQLRPKKLKKNPRRKRKNPKSSN